MTYVEVVKNCLDSGVDNRRDIYTTLILQFPQDNEYKLWSKVVPTMNYLNSKRIKVNKSRFESLGISLKGTAKSQTQQELLENYLLLISQKTTLRFPDTIYWTGSYSRNYAQKRYGCYRIKLSKNTSSDLLGILLHELVHINGHFNHKRGFFRRLIQVGKQCGLNLDNWFEGEYTRGKKYYEKVYPIVGKLSFKEVK